MTEMIVSLRGVDKAYGRHRILKGLDLNVMNTTFFLSRETLIPSPKKGMALWREKLFALMVRNA